MAVLLIMAVGIAGARDFSLSFSNTPFTPNLLSQDNAEKAENKKITAFLLNFFLGLGIGSFVQGDTTGGIIGLSGDLGGYALFLAGYFYIRYYGFMATKYVLMPLIFGGSAVIAAFRIFQLVRPFTYANRFSIAFSPGINAKGRPVFTSSVNLKF